MRNFDCAVIGTGPAGHKAIIQAAKLGKKVVAIERNAVLGGTSVNTGTIPSKALREAVLYLTGSNRRTYFGDNFRPKHNITIADLIFFSQQVIHNELQVIRDQFDRNNVELIWGKAHFEGPNLLQIERPEENELVMADKFVIAVGTRPARPESVPFNDRTIVCSDSLLKMQELPKSMIIVGGGVIGVEYACMLSTLGVRIILVEARPELLEFLDREIVEALQYQMRQLNITLRLGEKVSKIEENAQSGLVEARLESGKLLQSATLLYAVGRQGNAASLALDNIGVEFDSRGRLKVNEMFQTTLPHIYAAGDVIGFPALASTSMEQGRLAACHAFDKPCNSVPELFPYGIYSVPEISMVGQTEKQLTDAGVPYEAGVASYKEVARGQLLGDNIGMLKLLIHQQTRRLLGVHAIGTGATELIHIGQAVMAFNGTIDYFINSVFNYPTLAEAYKVAALNGSNKLAHV